MRGLIVSRYIASRFLRYTLGVYFACAALIFLVESIENLRRASARDVGIDTVLLLTVYRLPQLSEQIIPFAVLLGTIMTYVMLSRSLELAVTRAAGFSIWQLLAPAVVCSAGLGIFAAAVFNPLAANFSERYQDLHFQTFAADIVAELRVSHWLRQNSVDGPAVIHSADTREGGTLLNDVTIYVYAPDESFVERVEAKSAKLEPGRWAIESATIYRPDRPAEKVNEYFLSTYLTKNQMKLLTTKAETVSFWDLPGTIEINQKAGLPTGKLVFQYQSLLARPFLLVAMVLIAATVSMRIFRSGNIGKMIIGGIAAGFVFYVALKLLGDLGSAGVIYPALSVWGPVIIAILLGTNVLLFQEDG